jgi:hypothetical protein
MRTRTSLGWATALIAASLLLAGTVSGTAGQDVQDESHQQANQCGVEGVGASDMRDAAGAHTENQCGAQAESQENERGMTADTRRISATMVRWTS